MPVTFEPMMQVRYSLRFTMALTCENLCIFRLRPPSQIVESWRRRKAMEEKG